MFKKGTKGGTGCNLSDETPSLNGAHRNEPSGNNAAVEKLGIFQNPTCNQREILI